MELLKEMMLENELATIKEQVMGLHKAYRAKLNEVKAHNAKLLTEGLNEGVLDFESDDLGYQFDEIKKRFQAAQQGIKIANKLGDPEQKRRVFANFNKLRAGVARLEKDIKQKLAELEDQMRGQTRQNYFEPNQMSGPRTGAPQQQAPNRPTQQAPQRPQQQAPQRQQQAQPQL
jgi:ABC-type Zn uptake system ZnuABC Zn-binding protein ZnuA